MCADGDEPAKKGEEPISPAMKTIADIASLIATAKINEIVPFVYLKATLEAIAAGHPANRIDELLPWNFKPSS